MRQHIQVLFCAAVISLIGCGPDICEEADDFTTKCGGTVDRSMCDDIEAACTGDDIGLMVNYFDCVEASCADGEAQDESAFATCATELQGVSQGCMDLFAPPPQVPWTCADDAEEIWTTDLCDGFDDCDDGSDEDGC
jgi:hypothetical protein